MEMATEDVRLRQLPTVPSAEQKPRLMASEELNQELCHVLGEVNFTLPILGLEIVVHLAVPCLLINDDAGTVVEYLLDADSQRFADTQSARTTEDEHHAHLWLDDRRVGKMVHHFADEAGATLLLLAHLRDDQAHLLPVAGIDFLPVLVDARREDHLHNLEVVPDGLRRQAPPAIWSMSSCATVFLAEVV